MLRDLRLAAALLVASCVETVPLGRECEDQSEACIEDPSAPVASPRPTRPERSLDAGAAVDASDAPPPVARTPDAAAPRRLPLFPVLTNTSFEASEPGPLTSPDDDRTAPWVGCGIGWRVNERVFVEPPGGGDMQTVLPAQGSTFMEYVRPESVEPIAPLSQELAEPLERGQHYAVRMDVQSSANVDVSLEVWSGSDGETCTPARLLGTTGRIAAGAWSPVCVSFDAPMTGEVNELMIVANFDAVPSSSTRVLIDDLRSDPTCP